MTKAKKNIIEFKQVYKKMGQHQILENINFSLGKGEVLGIIGANGSGKTTILRLAAGLSYPSSGQILVNDNVITPGKIGNLPESIGILIEAPSFMDHLTGFTNLYYLSKIRNIITKQDIIQSLIDVGLDPYNTKKVRQYSLGMRQRLGIAQAIMEKPQLILFDEPTNGLDQEGILQFSNIIRTLTEQGTSFLFVSHSTDEIQQLCDRVLKIKNKSLVQEDNVNFKEWHIVLSNLEDVERVLQAKSDIRLTERHEGKPVIVARFTTEEELKIFFNKFNFSYEIFKVV
ncbi:ATP-binding cassette domain-containing protein [Paenibacillus turicensis]|uniref:ABC transporter ATP-binding protein n=1 Tax=Paenibacillus turicensis TaxID=160487 RepID=UPI003D290299